MNQSITSHSVDNREDRSDNVCLAALWGDAGLVIHGNATLPWSAAHMETGRIISDTALVFISLKRGGVAL